MLNWILCEDRLPKDNERVLLTVENNKTGKRGVTTSQMWEGSWVINVGIAKPIAWSEFPEPYQEVKENYYFDFDEKKMKKFFDELQINREIQKKKCDCNGKVKHLSKKVVKLQRKNRELKEMVEQYKELLYQTTKLLKEDKNG